MKVDFKNRRVSVVLWLWSLILGMLMPMISNVSFCFSRDDYLAYIAAGLGIVVLVALNVSAWRVVLQLVISSLNRFALNEAPTTSE